MNINQPTNILATLRALTPDRPVDFQTAQRVAERQAELFLLLSDVDLSQPIPTSIVIRLPRIKVVRDRISTSGMSGWTGGQWLIVVNSDDAPTRARLTTFHEFKHVIDHNQTDRLYTGRPWLDADARAADAHRQRERAADLFAGAVLIPRTRLLSLWAKGVRRPEDLAPLFDASPQAVAVRLEQVGLTLPRWQCSRGAKNPTEHHINVARMTAHTARILGLRDPRRTRSHRPMTPSYGRAA
jgi:Zn-dependent peptidase ImmA (M78 family)